MSTLLEQASLVMIPSGYKEDVVYSVKPTDGSGDLTFTRASDGTRVNSQGLVERVPWNLLQQSNQFDTTWTNTSSTETGGQSGYDGSTNAWKIDITAAFGQIIQNLPTSGYNTVSIYAKAGTLGFCRLRCDASTNAIADFDLSDGSLAYSFGIVSASSENVGNGWFRLQMYFNATATNLRVYPIVAANDLTATSGNIYIQDAQINEGSTAKPYFPTTDRLNVPRLTYQNGGGGCPSLLLEKQSTNLVTYSEQFDNADWTKLNTTVSANSVTSPDGTQNADTLTPTTTNGAHRVEQDKATATQVFTQSIFAKANGYNFVAVENGGEIAYFNLSTGVVGTVSAGTASIQNMGNGWYRCIFTATALNGKSYFYVANADNSISFAGNGTSGIYVWGAQHEAGSYATSYIPTTSSSATRVADACFKTGISSLIGGTSGTVFFDIKTNPTLSSALNKQFCYYTNSVGAQAYMFLDSTNLISTNSNWGSLSWATPFVANTRYKVALTYANNDFALYVNGTSVATASSGTPLNAQNLFSLGSYAGSSEWNEFVFNQYTHFPSRLTNAELASLTTI